MSWTGFSSEAGAFEGLPPADAEEWRPVALPARGSDDEDHWFRTAVDVPAPTVLRLGGLATICDVFLDGAFALRSESMFVEQELPVDAGTHELVICARALGPLLDVPRKPRARWRSKVPSNGSLRWFRTTLLGRAPGFAPGPPLVGPTRPIVSVTPDELRIDVRTTLDGADGIVEIRAAEEHGPLEASVLDATAALPPGGGTFRVPVPALWWPHTHGSPALHVLEVRSVRAATSRRIGFRRLEHAADLERDGLDLRVNGVPVFARGAVWVPPDRAEIRTTLERARDGGLNLVRVVGTTFYEDPEFHDLCDELGLLVWQDLMFANMDYPFADAGFLDLVEGEVAQLLREVGGRPSLAVVCGNSEIQQQVTMLGLPVELARSEFFDERVPAILQSEGIDAAYVPSAPTGGTLPFRTSSGVANYFGVGAYLRPLSDARHAAVRFASECLAFANVPNDDPSDHEAGVMRDVGADWDFADVRDFYVRMLHGIAPGDDGYWDHARYVTGEAMARVFGEWRRAASPCTGGIVLWLRDIAPGAGWGLLDDRGRPKVAWCMLREALAPVAVWIVDEGLNGLSVHVANDMPAPLAATLRVSLYRDGDVLVDEVAEPLELGAHGAVSRDVEGMFGRFVDLTYAYRFGEPQHDVVVATVARDGEILTQSFFFPLGSGPLPTIEGGGLEGHAAHDEGGAVQVTLTASSVLRGIRLDAPGFDSLDDGRCLEPGRPRTFLLAPSTGDASSRMISVRALNLEGTVEIPLAAPSEDL